MQPINPIWRRHDWQRFIRHDAHRFLTPAGIEAEKRAADAERAAQREADEIDAAELEALRADHERVRIELAEVKFALALRRICRKYREDQPRDDRGRWVDDPDKGRAEDAGKDGPDKQPELTDVSAQKKSLPALIKEFGSLTARQFVSRYCEARVNRELPGQFEDMTISDIWNMAKGGDARARTCMKLMSSGKYRK